METFTTLFPHILAVAAGAAIAFGLAPILVGLYVRSMLRKPDDHHGCTRNAG
jgi:hypothetical protein